MHVGSPAFLWILLLSAPIVALHMIRWRRQRVVVSTLRFWEEGAGPETRRLWLFRIWDAVSLALHLLILVVLAAGMAGIRIPGLRREPERVLLVIDDTPSMAAEQRLHRARLRMVEYWNRALSRGDRVTILLASGSVLPERSAEEGPPEIALEVSVPGRELGPRMEEWGRLRQFDRYVLFTDGSDPSVSTGGFWTVDAVGVSFRNVGFVGGGVDPASGQVALRIKNFSDRAADVAVAGRRLSLLAGAEEIVRFPPIEENGRVASFRIEPDDDFELDQEAFLVLPSRKPLPVVLVTPGRVNPFLWQALDLLVEEGGIDSSRRYLAEELPATWDSEWLGVFDHASAPASLPPGRYLLVPCPDRADPVSVGPVKEGIRVIWVAAELEGAGAFHVRRSRLFGESEGHEPVLRAEQGPIAVRGRIGGVAFAALGFRLEESDVQLTPLFPLWVRRSVHWLRDSRLFPAQITVGEVWRNCYPLGRNSVRLNGVAVNAPSGWVAVTALRPGILTATGEGFAESTAVNFFDSRESDLTLKIRSAGPEWPVQRWWWSWPVLSFASFLAIILYCLEGILWARNHVASRFDPLQGP